VAKPTVRRCAIYTRKSSEEGLELEYNSLAAQRDAAEAFIRSQKHEGWKALQDTYDDGGISGGHMERPGLQRLLQDVRAGKIDVVVVYKVDRLSRSLADFAQLMQLWWMRKPGHRSKSGNPRRTRFSSKHWCKRNTGGRSCKSSPVSLWPMWWNRTGCPLTMCAG
jgi:hypothetical protein